MNSTRPPLCHHCGAPLTAQLGTVQCAYCGKTTIVSPSGPPMHRPPQGLPVRPPPSSNAGAPLVVVFALFGMLTLGAVALIRLVAGWSSSSPAPAPVVVRGSAPVASGTSSETARAGTPPPPPPNVNSRVCMVADRNGDGVRELVALIGSPPDDQRAKRPAILDGASGEVIWVGASAGTAGDTYLLCAGDRWMGVLDDENFVLRLLPLDTPEREVRHVLTDEVFYYGSTHDCLRVRTDDGRRPSFSLTDGSPRSCDAPLRWRPHISHTVENGIISTLRQGAAAEHGGVRYRLTTRRPGTPFLEASASQRGRELWNVPLRFVPVGGEAIGTLAIAATPGVAVVFGSSRGGPRGEGVTAVGLNADGGTERFATSLPTTFIASVDDVYYNERYVIVRMHQRLVALDPTTGSIVWSLGG